MEKKFLTLGVVVFLAVVIIWFSTRKKTTTTTPKTKTTPDARTISTASSGGGYVSDSTPIVPANGLTITGVGQTVTGASPQQTVTAPARVINLQATPAGVYSGTAKLKTQGGTVLHTETLTNLNVIPGLYSAVYFNPQNPAWGITTAGTYVMEVMLVIGGVNRTATTNLVITNDDLQVSGAALTITGVGQTITGVSPQQNVAAPARVINLDATPDGTYSGTATLKTQGGTVLHVETLTNLNVSPGGYPAVFFNPQYPVWGVTQAGTYVMEVMLVIGGINRTATTNLVITNEDLGIVVGGGTSGVSITDYSINNGNEVVLSLTGGTNGVSTTIQLKQGATVVGTLTANYAASMTVTSSQYGYVDIFVDNTDIGSVYIPQQLSGAWTVQKAKAIDENGVMNLEFNKVGNTYVVTDAADDSGWANVEYWHNATLLGSTIPANYTVEPNIDQHITKKRWGNFGWLGYDSDGLHRQMSQITFKIVAQ